MKGMKEAKATPESDTECHAPPGKETGEKPWQFNKGAIVEPRRQAKNGSERVTPAPPRLLPDMRKVYGQDKSKDRTPGQRGLRKRLNESPIAFVEQLAGLEKAHLAMAGKSACPEKSDMTQS